MVGVVQASDQGASWEPLFGGFPNWEETRGVDPDLAGGIISHLGSGSPRRGWKTFLGREMSGKHNAGG